MLTNPVQSVDQGRRRLLQTSGALALAGLPAWGAAAPTVPAAPAAPLARLVLAGPPAIVSAPLIHMAETQALAGVAERVEFTPWRDPDQLRVMALGRKADVLAMPSNVAANLYNRGAGVTLLSISTWGALWIVTRDGARRTLADFRGEEIAVPFRGDMPDLMLQLLTARQGLDVRRDFRVRYVPTPMEAMQLLITRRVRHALLSEPAVSLALRKTQSFPLGLVAPALHRGADLQQEWGRVFQRAPRIPQAGIAAVGALRGQGAALAAVDAAYAPSVAWCRAHPQECGRMVAARIDLLTPDAVADALATSQLDAVPAQRARAEVDFFFQQLLARDPALLGGRLPDSGFFHSPAQPHASNAAPASSHCGLSSGRSCHTT
ncbi:ABC transporter substrate-binding protein [Diaphorobacter nitroreducens]|uniref:ABC transporter substrate-binding protein n=1 Tax=Diaphorobacter nitroreducens TaxID=164759 RepID=UPI0028AC7A0A|nr:ABC transporter substrate-binding protein [Diaphorobacter nitroreducens]